MADDQTPKSFDDAVDPSQDSFEVVEPAGEQLGQHVDATPEFQVVDAEAEELRGEPVPDATPGHADPEDVQVDDPQQLAEAEALAARARSSRPVRKQRSRPAVSDDKQPAAADVTLAPGDDADPQATAQQLAAARPRRTGAPVRRTAGATAAPPPADELASDRDAETAMAASRPVRRTRQPAESGDERTGRGVATTRSSSPAQRRTTPAAFTRQSVDELRKVIWPTSQQLGQYFVVVLLFVLFIVAFVGLLDFAFGWTLLKLFGKK